MVLLTVVGCKSDEEQAPYLSIMADGVDLSASALFFGQASASATVQVKSNAQWRVNCTAEWVDITPAQGSGNGSFKVSVPAAALSRSAVVTISLSDVPQVLHSFDVVQRVSPAEDEPNTTPTPDTDPSPDENPDDGEDDNTDDGSGGNTDDNGDTDDSDNNPAPGGNQGDDSNDNNEDNPEEEPTPDPDERGDYTMVDKLQYLAEGHYYIGGYQDGVLHLATGGLTEVNHCKTAVFEFAEDGSLKVGDVEPAEVVLEPTDKDNAYYIRFVEYGYLTARAAGAGKLQFKDEKSEYWLFSAHEEGGFLLHQSGEEDVKLIISQNAQSDVLRSIAGDEDANAVVLLRINNLNK